MTKSGGKGKRKLSRKMRPMTAVDLFCGCGGLSVGLKKAGFKVVGAVDIDPLSVETYKANHREVKVWQSDIRQLNPSQIIKELGFKKMEVDLLAGCPPCQGFSKMRTLNGAVCVEDDRNDLVTDFYRFVKEIRPRTVMMENVPGLAADKRFLRFLSLMEEIGYKGGYRILNTVEYGVPQNRKRLIYLAGLNREIPFAAPVRKQKTVRDTISALPKSGRSGDPVHDFPEKHTPKVMEMIRQIPKNGGSRTDLPKRYHLPCHLKCDGFKDVYGRMKWDAAAPTITSGCFNPSKGRFLHPRENRAITMREAALLQSFPKRYKFPVTDNKASVALMIGNALPPAFIAAHAKCIAKSIISLE